mgnify:CR=1 FL=1
MKIKYYRTQNKQKSKNNKNPLSIANFPSRTGTFYREIVAQKIQQQENIVQNLQADVYFEGDEIQLKLQKAIATLPEKQKLVFNMKYFQDLKYEEISEILETSVGGLKASYHLAVKKIEAYLKTD